MVNSDTVLTLLKEIRKGLNDGDIDGMKKLVGMAIDALEEAKAMT